MAPPEFPIYRKYKNGVSWFKIIDETHFEEVKKMPSGYQHFFFEAKILPDRNLIQDMLFDYELYWDEIEADEFNEVRGLSDFGK